MRNLSSMKCPMPVQAPEKRIENFTEVVLGYTEEMAMEEARRCLNCPKKPCQSGCPVGINIPEFISCVARGAFEEAYECLSAYTALPAVCGRVCPQESQCEKNCVRGIKGEPVEIGYLERFVADWHREHMHANVKLVSHTGHRVAIVGAGPSGLTAAGELARKGHQVTVFEALHVAGGVLSYGIPEFRLPKDIVASEIQTLEAMGVEIKTNMVIGKVLTLDELFKEHGYEAVYIASGAGLPKFMNLVGENLKGVYSANEYLTRINLMKAYRPDSKTPIYRGRNVVVIGGGNVAMDAARSALRMGAEQVSVLYRRGMEDIPARKEEVDHAVEEGVVFKTLTLPSEILGDENEFVCGVRCHRMELQAPGNDGRRTPVIQQGSEFTVAADCVIIAIGTSPNSLILDTTPGLTADAHGCILTKNESGVTSRAAVWAGGDAVTGAATVIKAMQAGKQAALDMDAYLGGDH